MMEVLKQGVQVSLDDIQADEFQGILAIAEERNKMERERTPPSGYLGCVTTVG